MSRKVEFCCDSTEGVQGTKMCSLTICCCFGPSEGEGGTWATHQSASIPQTVWQTARRKEKQPARQWVPEPVSDRSAGWTRGREVCKCPTTTWVRAGLQWSRRDTKPGEAGATGRDTVAVTEEWLVWIWQKKREI